MNKCKKSCQSSSVLVIGTLTLKSCSLGDDSIGSFCATDLKQHNRQGLSLDNSAVKDPQHILDDNLVNKVMNRPC